MVTAILTLSPEKTNRSVFSQNFLRLARRFESKVTIRRGNSRPFDISFADQLKELSIMKSPHFVIQVEGRNEMKTVSVLVDFFNHGLGV